MAKLSAKETLGRKLRKQFWKLNDEFKVIEEGDYVMVCLSGGKDSYTMLDALMHVQESKVIDFKIIAVNLDQKQPDFPEHILPEYFEKLNVPYKIVEQDTYSVVVDKIPVGKTMCSLCSRLRRGVLYDLAKELGCNKVALGHHKDDILETFFLNLLYSGKLETMPAKYITDDNALTVIRPLSYCKESDIAEYSSLKGFPIIPCNLCGSQDGMQRQAIKNLLSDWENKFPGRKEVIFNALGNISPSHLFDTNLFDFAGLSIEKIKA